MKTMSNECLTEQHKRFKGTVRGTRQRFGFLNVQGQSDIFIKPQEMDRVFAGDFVEVVVENHGKKNENLKIKNIINTEFKQCIGVFSEDETGAYVLPDDFGFNKKIRIPNAYRKFANNGDYVKVEIIEHPFKTKKPKAKILEVIGHVSNTGIEAEYFISKYNIPTRLSADIYEENNFIIENYNKKNNSLKRKNLTKLNFITIDGESTIDIDDAIYVQKLKNKWKLLVAISDVAEYIEEGGAIDNEAYKRTSTVYLTGRTIPMLPAELAHDYLSLTPLTKRAVIIADMTLSLDGKLEKYDFYEAFIESKVRLTYNEIDQYLETERLTDNAKPFKKEIDNLKEIHLLIKNKRKEENIIPAKRFSYKYLLNEKKQIEHIQSLYTQQSYKLVEEAMLLANRCAADFISDSEKGIFKIQNGILDNKKRYLSMYLRNFVFFENSMFDNMTDFKHLFNLIEEEEQSESIKQFINLHLDKSNYSETIGEHFTMGFNGYTYFTSPIRRYSDILIHRMIKSKINKKKYDISREGYINHFIKKEKQIQDCSLQVDKWLKANYIQKHKDVVFNANIIGFNSFGMIVKININGIDGFVSTKNKNVYKKSDFEYIIDNNNFNIMDEVKIKLKNVQDGYNLLFEVI